MKTSLIILRTLIFVTCALLLFGWLALSLRALDHNFRIVLPTWIKLLGITLMAMGGLIVFICGGILSTREIGTPGDLLFPKEFVAFGPFRYVRNPMSLGAVILLIGFGLCYRSISILLSALLLFLIFHLVAVFVEEPGLEKRFGGSYREYKKRVNRWIPKWK